MDIITIKDLNVFPLTCYLDNKNWTILLDNKQSNHMAKTK